MIPYMKSSDTQQLKELLRSREVGIDPSVNSIVEGILARVKEQGDQAVLDYTEQFDHVRPEKLLLDPKEMDRATERIEPSLWEAFSKAAENIREFHEKQKQNSYLMEKEDGVLMGQRVRGLQRVGLYVPGGTAAYPSSVLMNAIPAKVAGVEELIMVTPKASDMVLAAAKIAGVDKIYQVGGAQAIAALAYGTETIPKVDKIVGPGNIFVATAKRLLYGIVDIDMIAGPSEILILCDEGANPSYVAADMMSQAEHDKLASSIVLCTSETLAKEIQNEVERQLTYLSRSEIIKESLSRFGRLILCKDLWEAVEIANQVAPEHLELMVEDPFRYLSAVKNAGSVFMGYHSPEPLGDYFGGPNHVLPTNGTARFFSPLGVDAFLKKSSYICYSREALEKAAPNIEAMAKSEGLDAHGNSIAVRFEK